MFDYKGNAQSAVRLLVMKRNACALPRRFCLSQRGEGAPLWLILFFCMAAVLWSKGLKDRPSGIKAGTHVGSLIYQHLRDVQLSANQFYPDADLFHDVLVLPALKKLPHTLQMKRWIISRSCTTLKSNTSRIACG